MEPGDKLKSETATEAAGGESLGEWIRDARGRLRLTQRQLADRAGISRSYLCDIERGRGTRPSVATFDRLAKALGVVRSDLLLAAGVIEEQTGQPGDPGEHRLIALYRDLGPANRLIIERFARFLREDEHHFVQRSLLDDLPAEAPVRPSGPTLFDLPDPDQA